MADNPLAFPNTGNSTWRLQPEQGMTLRDWFAGQALAGLLGHASGESPSQAPTEAYKLADAMLAERAK